MALAALAWCLSQAPITKIKCLLHAVAPNYLTFVKRFANIETVGGEWH